LGRELDGYYILLEETRRTTPPATQIPPYVTDNAWALHRKHICAGRCIILFGPDPESVYPAVSWPELDSALQDELNYVEEHLEIYPDYCILNLCRLIYSFETRDVVISKGAAAAWAWDVFPQWRPHIDAARNSYARKASDEDIAFMKSEVKPLFHFACERIQLARGN